MVLTQPHRTRFAVLVKRGPSRVGPARAAQLRLKTRGRRRHDRRHALDDVIARPRSDGGLRRRRRRHDRAAASPPRSRLPPETGLHLEVGSQTFEGGPGNDIVYGDRGNDTLRGNGGNDRSTAASATTCSKAAKATTCSRRFRRRQNRRPGGQRLRPRRRHDRPHLRHRRGLRHAQLRDRASRRDSTAESNPTEPPTSLQSAASAAIG